MQLFKNEDIGKEMKNTKRYIGKKKNIHCA